MRIATRVVWDMNTSELLEWEGYEYEGPVALAGGGPSSAQNRAADSQTAINSQLAKTAQQNEDYTEAQRNKTTPFYGDLMKNGPDYTNAQLDYAGGTNARAFAPAKAALIQRIGQSTGLPSGYRDQALTDFDEGRATAYDNSLSGIYADRQAAKERGAAGLMGEAQQANPLGYYGAATQGNTSILNANLRKPGIGGIIGGIVGGGANAAAAFA